MDTHETTASETVNEGAPRKSLEDCRNERESNITVETYGSDERLKPMRDAPGDAIINLANPAGRVCFGKAQERPKDNR